MASKKMKNLGRVQAQRLLQRIGADKDAQIDEEFEDMEERYRTMVTELNKLGDGLAESLTHAKTLFLTNHRLAQVLDHFYNGELAHRWPEVNSDVTMQQHNAALELRMIWEACNKKHRSSAAFVNIQLALNQLRAFMGGVKEVKAKNRERNEAELEYNYRRRAFRTAERKNPTGNQVPRLKVASDMAMERAQVLTEQQKDQMVKDKIARDAVIDEYTVSTIVCQAEMFRQLSEDLNDLVDKLPQDKVTKIRSQIKDLVQLGGPRVDSDGPSGLQMAAKLALGVTTMSEEKESERKRQEASEANAELRRQQGIAIAKAEETVRSGSRRQHQGETLQVSRLPNLHSSHITRMQAAGSSTPAEQPPPPPQNEVSEVVVAQFPHEVEAEGDLQFAEGDHIAVISKDPSGWANGKNLRTGETGMFPMNYTASLELSQQAKQERGGQQQEEGAL